MRDVGKETELGWLLQLLAWAGEGKWGAARVMGWLSFSAHESRRRVLGKCALHSPATQ